jgi:hypothetical protein
MNPSPTSQTYASLTAAYDYFNAGLFDGELPPCLITMQRHKGAYGYFSSERFASADNPTDITDEIALNPAHFATRSAAAVLSTLAHEMAHLWQHHFGTPSRTGYHNKEWAVKMREIGLIPTDTGEPGGKDTGQRVTHMIEEGGLFARVCSAFLATSPAVLYQDRAGDDSAVRKKKAASKTKYTCPTCGLNAWAKPDAPLICGDCESSMESEPAEDNDAIITAKAGPGSTPAQVRPSSHPPKLPILAL